MAALSTSTYGKASPMTMTGIELADRLTAALENAHGALGELNDGAANGAPVSQAAVNTLSKVVQDLSGLAADARKAAADDEAEDAADREASARAGSAPAGDSGTGTAAKP